jgi:hypothetical protein
MPSLPRLRTVALSLLVGVLALALTASLDRLHDYPISAFGTGPVEWIAFGLGVTVFGAVPVLLLLRFGLVSPSAVSTLVAWTFLVPAATGPAPEFSELGGYTVVSGTLHLRNYVQGWYCWLLVAVLAGLVEHVARADLARLPSVRRRLPSLDRGDRVTALRVAAVVGVAHLAAVVALAAEYSYFAPDSSFARPLVLAWALPGAVALAATPAYLLARYRLLAPLAAFSYYFYRVAVVMFLPMPDDSLPVYLIGWPAFVGAGLAVGGLEVLVRRLAGWLRGRPQST